jgi:RHO1 GDP-GTP exchange protein 1/2
MEQRSIKYTDEYVIFLLSSPDFNLPFSQPIPLDLLTLANFTDPPTQRNAGILRRGRGGGGGGGGGDKSDGYSPGPSVLNSNSPDTATDSRAVYPCTLHHNGRLGGLWTLFADSAQARNEWKQKLEEAIGLRKVVQESNKVFEVETLSADTFLVPSILPNGTTPAYSHESTFTGKVTCSVPFSKYCCSPDATPC